MNVVWFTLPSLRLYTPVYTFVYIILFYFICIVITFQVVRILYIVPPEMTELELSVVYEPEIPRTIRKGHSESTPCFQSQALLVEHVVSRDSYTTLLPPSSRPPPRRM